MPTESGCSTNSRPSTVKTRHKTGLARINDRIETVYYSLNSGSRHIMSVNEKSLLEGLTGETAMSLRDPQARWRLLTADRDLFSPDIKTKSGICSGCSKTINLRQTRNWLEHKLRCRVLQQKLREHLLRDVAQASEISESEYASDDDTQKDDEQIRAHSSGLKRKEGTFLVRINGRVRHCQISGRNQPIKRGSKTIQEIFYGTKLSSGQSTLRWKYIRADPDAIRPSEASLTCICRGCKETISLRATDIWLGHRLSCPVLQSVICFYEF
ncbi:hypothetical protein DFH11DRAFT_739791 [Phellopilus nigrolimitatus]|nr:hypothetical protein DFH11DRAFT_739791 [Phellopilus nigrolimitatus]